MADSLSVPVASVPAASPSPAPSPSAAPLPVPGMAPLPPVLATTTDDASASSASFVNAAQPPPVSVHVDIRVHEGDSLLKPKKKSQGGRGDHDDDDGVELNEWELMLNSVVKVFCTSTTPNYAQPWQMKRQEASTSSGFVIHSPLSLSLSATSSSSSSSSTTSTATSGSSFPTAHAPALTPSPPPSRLILGNAHGVTNSSSIRVRKHGDAKKYPAYVAFMSHEADLCLLHVPDGAFWSGLHPLELGDVPRVHENVSVAGYPTGGDNLSVTKGVVSRVIMGTYSHSGEELLVVQIDAAINSGNSGGPAMLGKKVVGVAFETLNNAQNIGYIIPTPVIRHFLTDIAKHGRYTSFPKIGFHLQKLENESLRKAFKLSDDLHGLLVQSVDPLTSCAPVLRKNDILLSFDGVPIADDGTIFFRRGERLLFRYIESVKYVGDTMTARVWREGKMIDVEFKLEIHRYLVPLHLHDQLPSYFVYAGCVFTVLSRAYLYHEWGKEWHKKGPVEFVDAAYYGVIEEQGQQVVILSQILVDDVNNGYQFANLILRRVNDVKVHNLAQMVTLVEESHKKGEPFIRFDLDRNNVIILDTTMARESTPRILKQNNISCDRSIDLMYTITNTTPPTSAPTSTATASSNPSASNSS